MSNYIPVCPHGVLLRWWDVSSSDNKMCSSADEMSFPDDKMSAPQIMWCQLLKWWDVLPRWFDEIWQLLKLTQVSIKAHFINVITHFSEICFRRFLTMSIGKVLGEYIHMLCPKLCKSLKWIITHYIQYPWGAAVLEEYIWKITQLK